MAAKTTIPERQEWKNWREVKPSQWPWPHFSPEEIACRGTGRLVVHKAAMDRLEAIRVELGAPMTLNSAYRSPEHNRIVGGEPNSYHMANRMNSATGEAVMAFDVSMLNHEPWHVIEVARKHGMKGIGHYPRQNFLHIDNGPSRTWNGAGQNQFPRRVEKPADVPVRFDPEPAKPSMIETAIKPEIVGPLAAGASALGVKEAVSNPANPIAWAVGAILIAGLAWFILRQFLQTRNKNSVTKPGAND